MDSLRLSRAVIDLRKQVNIKETRENSIKLGRKKPGTPNIKKKVKKKVTKKLIRSSAVSRV